MSEELKREEGVGSSLELLDALGIGPVWVRRELAHEEAAQALAPDLPVAVAPAVIAAAPVVAAPAPRPVVAAPAAPAIKPAQPVQPATAPQVDDGVPSWLHEMDFAASAEPLLIPDQDDDEAAPALDPMVAKIAAMDWSQVRQTVSDCRRCGLCNGRKNTVFGVGDEKARWLFIGEGPGRNEDLQGEPFIGPAGKLLDNMLLSMGVRRGENAYIANIVKCRPTDDNGRDRPPSPQEVAACMPYLQRQIALIQPTVLVALGKTAALSLLGLDPSTPVSKLRGTVHRYQDLPLVVTYHPAYLLRTLADKSRAWADLCLAMSTYQQNEKA
ncbi:uracil-DNA glycosylase [Herbaspirillum sp. alder98]|uniref:uracil-DNA glycosylase n=1 Tax=Herbaspirillum sp. alder98 TaxID=2913096 RepID=UPI001CD8BE72|nr:uracil-DNA glycosylase [Herbaspirillum sp. alder98]MCA1323492.1 uracil-DNA glycosylase [Herbaspirillum sp. alder98]